MSDGRIAPGALAGVVVVQNGWQEGCGVRMPDPRRVAHTSVWGLIDRIDPQRFGPACCVC